MKKTNAVISINPQFVEQIMAGKKHFEFRKSFFKEIPEICYIYSTKPVGKVVGFFTIKQVLVDNPEKIWELTYKKSGISREFFDEYYLNKNKAVAIQIDRLFKFKQPKLYKDIDANGKIPLSYKRI
jgi:predicted transcriptional regulator